MNFYRKYVQENTAYSFVDLGVNSISILIMFYCYGNIVHRVRNSRLLVQRYRRYMENSLKRSNSERKSSIFCVRPTPVVSRRELRLFFQFCAVSLIFLVTFAAWQCLPHIHFEAKWVGFAVTTLFFINNCTNPTVYLFFNSSLRREVGFLLCFITRTEQRVLSIPERMTFLAMFPQVEYRMSEYGLSEYQMSECRMSECRMSEHRHSTVAVGFEEPSSTELNLISDCRLIARKLSQINEDSGLDASKIYLQTSV